MSDGKKCSQFEVTFGETETDEDTAEVLQAAVAIKLKTTA